MGINYHPNILTPLQEKALEGLSSYQELQSFYLTGGTALAVFYLHHRYSDDLDFFTHEEFDPARIARVMQDLVMKNGWTIDSSRNTTFFYEVRILEKQGEPILKIDFVKDIPAHFGDYESWKKIRVDSLRNIFSNKMTAIFGRTEMKDFVDLYFLLKENLPLWELFEEAEQKDGGLTEFLFAAQLRNIQKLKLLPRMIKLLSLEELQSTILKLANKFLDRVTPT